MVENQNSQQDKDKGNKELFIGIFLVAVLYFASMFFKPPNIEVLEEIPHCDSAEFRQQLKDLIERKMQLEVLDDIQSKAIGEEEADEFIRMSMANRRDFYGVFQLMKPHMPDKPRKNKVTGEIFSSCLAAVSTNRGRKIFAVKLSQDRQGGQVYIEANPFE